MQWSSRGLHLYEETTEKPWRLGLGYVLCSSVFQVCNVLVYVSRQEPSVFLSTLCVEGLETWGNPHTQKVLSVILKLAPTSTSFFCN